MSICDLEEIFLSLDITIIIIRAGEMAQQLRTHAVFSYIRPKFSLHHPHGNSQLS